ncbi:MAG: DUF975 family protein [Lachnospiraceae bacterium]|nr:DUF975 family protein [Lachnospiraceae bacterium]
MEKPVTKEIKCYARCVLTGKHASLAGITLLLEALNLLLSALALQAAPYESGVISILLYFGCSILVNIIYYILLAGLYGIYLDIVNNRSYRWKDLFAAFTEHPEPVAIFSVIQYVLSYVLMQVVVWGLSIVINWAFYGEAENLIISTAVVILTTVLYIYLQISFAMVLFVRAADPWQSFGEMMKKGWQLMDGRRSRYFTMMLSFIGMYLLGLLSFGIGFLFVNPYVFTTEGYFYKMIEY